MFFAYFSVPAFFCTAVGEFFNASLFRMNHEIKGVNLMKFKIRYDNKFQELDLSVEDASQWVNVSIGDELTEEEIQQLIQERIDAVYNMPEYNEWHRENRHIGGNEHIKATVDRINHKRGESYNLDALYADNSQEEERERRYQDEAIRGWLTESLKPKDAALAIAIISDRMSIQEYAAAIGDKANNVSHRWNRLKRKLAKKILEKRPF